MLHISDAERRNRLAIRHGLVRRFATVEDAVRGMTVLHATEAATVHLSLWARVAGVSVADVERILYDERSVVKQLAMRRTLFVFPRDLLPAALGSASRRVGRQQRVGLTKELLSAGVTTTDKWIDETAADVVALLADGKARTTSEIRAEVPGLGLMRPSGQGALPVGPVVMALLSAEGRVLRAVNTGHWRLNKPAWTSAEDWLGEVPAPLEEHEGYAELVRRWLGTFGPGTEADIVWWLGATKSAVRRALADVDAVKVSLDGGGTGWILPDDTDPAGPAPASAQRPAAANPSPASAGGPVGTNSAPMSAQGPMGAEPASKQRPAGPAPASVQGPVGAAPASAQGPVGANPASVQRPMGADSASMHGSAGAAPASGDRSGDVEPWAALLPSLDPTVMGWKERDFYLDPADKPFLFDTNGNAGTTAWWNGRIVGCWLQDDQDPAAPVRLVIHDDIGKQALKALEAEAERLTDWLDGVRITNVYASPQMRGLRLP